MIYSKDEKIDFEIKNLVDSFENFSKGVDIYCDLMKQIFLSSSSKN